METGRDYGDWSEDPERGPNARVNQEFVEGAHRDSFSEEQTEEETVLGVHIDPETESEWEREFEKQLEAEDIFDQERAAVGRDQYQLQEEIVEEDHVRALYTIDLSQVDPEKESGLPSMMAMNTDSIETVLNAAYRDLEIEAETGEYGLQIAVEYPEPESQVEGVGRVMEVYESFDEILNDSVE